MTKPQKTTRTGGDSPEQQTVRLMLESIAELIERARLEITGSLKEINESLNIIARQIKRQIPEAE
jgi:hypothetical protein